MPILDSQYNPAIAEGGKYDVADFDVTGASSGQAPIYNGSTVAWATPAVAPGAIALPEGNILVGDNTGDAAAVDASTFGQILIGDGTTLNSVAVSGAITIDNAGVTTLTPIVNADVDAAAAIDFSKLAVLTSGNILVGSAGNVATSVAMSGDVTIDNTGATTIGAGAIDLAMLSSGITPSHVIKFAGQPTTVGGGAAEAITVTGALNTDLAFVQMVDDGTNNVTIVNAVVTANTLTVTFSADPGNDCVINYQIIRAAA